MGKVYGVEHMRMRTYIIYAVFIWAMIIGAIIAVSAVDQYTVILGNEALGAKQCPANIAGVPRE